ncbi:unnamed protein product [Penicillium pancosmium]
MPRPKVRAENRQRSCRACLACKASKIRCDGKDPCESCLRRDLSTTCIYSGVDRRRKGQGKPGDVEPVANAPSLPLGSLTTSCVSPDAPAILMENSISVEQVTPSLSPQATSLDYTIIDDEDVSRISDMGGKVNMGETSSLSFLHFLKRTIKGYIGSVPFTEERVPHVTSNAGSSAVENETQILSFDERSSLLDSYLEATSGVLDLLSAYELETLLSNGQDNLPRSPRVSGDLKAIFDLVFAIGAQARGVGSDPQVSTSHFLRARATAFQGMLMTQTLDMVRIFTLLTFYTLGACNRNAASMFLSVAAKAAVILGLNATGTHQNSPEEETCAR